MPRLTASAILQERVNANQKITVLTGTKVETIEGGEKVEGIMVSRSPGSQGSKQETLKVDGVLVHIGTEPDTSCLEGIIPLDKQGYVIVNSQMQTPEPHIFAAGDIRSGSPRQVVTAVGDGAIAAITANRLLQEEG